MLRKELVVQRKLLGKGIFKIFRTDYGFLAVALIGSHVHKATLSTIEAAEGWIRCMGGTV